MYTVEPIQAGDTSVRDSFSFLWYLGTLENRERPEGLEVRNHHALVHRQVLTHRQCMISLAFKVYGKIIKRRMQVESEEML